MRSKFFQAFAVAVCALPAVWVATPAAQAQNAPSVRILLPERTRLLQGQLVDLVLEVRNAAAVTRLKATAGDAEHTSRFGAATDFSARQGWTGMRAPDLRFITTARRDVGRAGYRYE